MASDQMSKDIVIYYNDSIDSDNTAGALALAMALVHRPDTRVLWILEPRQVSLGLSMSKEEIARCLELIKQCPSSARGTPFKILLGGLLEEKDLANFECLDASDRELASLISDVWTLRWANTSPIASESSQAALRPQGRRHLTRPPCRLGPCNVLDSVDRYPRRSLDGHRESQRD